MSVRRVVIRRFVVFWATFVRYFTVGGRTWSAIVGEMPPVLAWFAAVGLAAMGECLAGGTLIGADGRCGADGR